CGILPAQLFIGKFCLGIFEEHFNIAMAGSGIQIVRKLLYIINMIAFSSGQLTESFLNYRILAFPEVPGNAELLLIVTYSTNSFFPPSIGFAFCVFVGHIAPGKSICTIIFPHCAPLSFRKVRSPSLPVLLSVPILCQL